MQAALIAVAGVTVIAGDAVVSIIRDTLSRRGPEHYNVRRGDELTPAAYKEYQS